MSAASAAKAIAAAIASSAEGGGAKASSSDFKARPSGRAFLQLTSASSRLREYPKSSEGLHVAITFFRSLRAISQGLHHALLASLQRTSHQIHQARNTTLWYARD